MTDVVTRPASTLSISGLRAGIEGREILKGIDLEVRSGEVHVVMGPNGSGKSTLAHVIMGNADYTVYAGSVRLDGVDVLALPTWQRARAGLFLAMQYPIEVPGVSLEDLLTSARAAAGQSTDQVAQEMVEEAARIGLDPRLLSRSLNVDFSGGEKKRNETVQLVILRPRIAVLDELDSGLDIDALRAVSRRIEVATGELGVGVLAITHYNRLLHELKPDVIHVMRGGRIVATGGSELAEQLEQSGYAGYDDNGEGQGGGTADGQSAGPADPFADPVA